MENISKKLLSGMFRKKVKEQVAYYTYTDEEQPPLEHTDIVDALKAATQNNGKIYLNKEAVPNLAVNGIIEPETLESINQGRHFIIDIRDIDLDKLSAHLETRHKESQAELETIKESLAREEFTNEETLEGQTVDITATKDLE